MTTEATTRARRPQRRLRVGVPAYLHGLPGGSGHTNVWRQVLPRLAARTRLRPVRQPGRHGLVGRVRPPQVWLGDGHRAPLPVSGPQVLQVHEAGWASPELRATLGAEFLSVLERNVARSLAAATRVLTPSEAARQQLIDVFAASPEKICVVNHGVDLDLFRPGRLGGPAIVERFGGDATVSYVLFVSILHPRKNLAALRVAMEGLGRRGFPHQLVIVAGRPPDRDDVDELAAAAFAPLTGVANRVVRVGTLSDEDLATLIAGTAAFCQPSLMDGFGLSVLEAMACGVPVVVSDRGALPEVVGEAGVAVPPTADAVEAGLLSVLDDPDRAASLGRAAHERARQFTWDRTADGWLRVLGEAATLGRP